MNTTEYAQFVRVLGSAFDTPTRTIRLLFPYDRYENVPKIKAIQAIFLENGYAIRA